MEKLMHLDQKKLKYQRWNLNVLQLYFAARSFKRLLMEIFEANSILLVHNMYKFYYFEAYDDGEYQLQ